MQQTNRRPLIAPILYLSIVTILFALAAGDLRGGEQFIPVFLLGLPWSFFLAPMIDRATTGPENPVISRIVLFLFCVVACGGTNATLIYLLSRFYYRLKPPSHPAVTTLDLK